MLGGGVEVRRMLHPTENALVAHTTVN